MKTLADFKRSMASGSIAVIVDSGYPHRYEGLPRTTPDYNGISNIMVFEPGGSRMGGLKASEWTFIDTTAMWTDSLDPRNWVTYEVWGDADALASSLRLDDA